MTANILIIAAPFGFGPAAKALILANGLVESAKVTINIDGDASAFVEQFRAPAVAVAKGRFGQLFGNRAALTPFDLVVSINHVPALAALDQLGLLARTVFFDSLFQWRAGSTKDAVPKGLLAVLVQDYPGLDQGAAPAPARQQIRTAPLIWPLPPDEPAPPRQGWTLHLGGMTSPLAPWQDIAAAASAMIRAAHALAVEAGVPLTVIGNHQLQELGLAAPDLDILGNVSPEHSRRLLAASALVITTPGIGAVYESLASRTPVVLLPPMNSTQYHHFKVLTGLGFPGSLPQGVADKMRSHLEGHPWELQTRVCLSVLKNNLPALLSGLGQAVATASTAGEAQYRVFDSLSRDDAVTIIGDLARRVASQAPPRQVSDDSSAKRRLEALGRYVLALPKVELHVHLEGSIRPELMLRLAKRNGIRLPFTSAEEFRKFQVFRNFRDFANLLLMGVHCLRQRQDFFELVADAGAQLASQNIVYAEVTWTPQFYLNRGIPLDDILGTMNEARGAVKAKWGVEMRWIPDIVRSFPQPAREIARWASSERSRAGGVVALGLGGPEDSNPASFFAEPFELARQAGLPANPHAGEGLGADSVVETLDSLNPRRLGHGVRASEDAATLARLIRDGVTLEVCPTSNLKLGVYKSYGEHPLKALVAAGCKVTINSDDPVLFATNLSREYQIAVAQCGLDLPSLQQCILNAAEACYLPETEKQDLIARLARKIQQVNGQFLGGKGP